MKKNMGSADRIIRILIAAVVVLLYFTSVISGIVAVILLVVSGIFILTSFVSFCPLYLPLGLNTMKRKK